MSIIEVQHVAKIFGKKPEHALALVAQGVSKSDLLNKHQHALGLYDINLNIEAGEVFVIMGLSGSGKSTLIRHFNRLIEPTRGDIIVRGENVTQLSKKALRSFRRNAMSMVFQHFGLMPHRNVLENTAYALRTRGVKKHTAFEQAREWLDRVGLSGFEKQYPQQLSGGRQQRIGLARALAANTDILLMDEAFSALDPLIRAQMQEELLSLQQQLKKTVVFITHDLSEAIKIGNRIAILNDGKLAQVGTPEDILLNPADDYVREFVQGVDLARSLNVESIMQSPVLSLEDCPLEQAHQAMQDKQASWVWVKREGLYQGLVTLEDLTTAINTNANRPLSDIAKHAHPIEADASIENTVPIAINKQHPIPVVDKNGKLAGVVDAQKVSQLYQ